MYVYIYIYIYIYICILYYINNSIYSVLKIYHISFHLSSLGGIHAAESDIDCANSLRNLITCCCTILTCLQIRCTMKN